MIIYVIAYDYITAYEPEMEFRHVCDRGTGWTLASVFPREAEGHPERMCILSHEEPGRIRLLPITVKEEQLCGCHSNSSPVQCVHITAFKEKRESESKIGAVLLAMLIDSGSG